MYLSIYLSIYLFIFLSIYQEIEDPNYDKRQLPVTETRAAAKVNSDNLGCFGASKNKAGPRALFFPRLH